MSENRNITDWIDDQYDWPSPVAHDQARLAEDDLINALREMKHLIDKTLTAYEQGGVSAWHGVAGLASSFHRTDLVSPIASKIGTNVAVYMTLAQTLSQKGEK